MAYLGNTPTTQSFISGTDYFNGTGSQTAFTLTRTVNSVNDIEVVINNVVQQPNTAYTLSGTTITFTSAPSAGSSNIYVRYLSTTTQSITPSQNTVSYSTLNSDTQSKLGISFKNRIINGAMVIDQRNAGASLALSNITKYTVDRFAARAATGSSNTAQQTTTAPAGFVNSLKITSGSNGTVAVSDNNWIYQSIEGYNIADLNWGTVNAKTITLSFQAYSSLTGTFGGVLRNSAGNRAYPFTYTISTANTWTTASITIPGDTSGTWESTNGEGISVFFGLGSGSNYLGTAGAWASADYRGATGEKQLFATSGATFYLTSVQFEVGTQATTFDYRSIGTELSLCQRYYARNFNPTFAGIGTASSAVVIPRFPVTMRAAPTMSAITTANIDLFGVGSVNASSTTLDSISTTGCRAYYGGMSGSTFGQPGHLTNDAIQASAEL